MSEKYEELARSARCLAGSTATPNWNAAKALFQATCTPYKIMEITEDFDRVTAEREAALAELAQANEKIDKAWNRKPATDHKGFIPGAMDAWKRPVPQHLPYDFSGNPGSSATQYCNGWNDCGGYWSEHAKELQQRLTAADERADVLETALRKIKSRLDAYAEADMRMPEPSVEVCQMIADAALKPAGGGGEDKRKSDFIRLNSAPHCPECGHPDCNGQCFGDDMMGD